MAVHRVAKLNQESTRPRSVVVKLSSPLVRDSLLAATKTFNKDTKNDKLNTSHLGIAGDKTPIYVTEHLSPANKVLHAAARMKSKEKGFEFVWVRKGKVFMRKNTTSKILWIKDNKSLEIL
ncbi:unnamed protein product [Plutella xylostella]|uniref:(diamondback moth) hypothetical protein n=1 Tax=Plutella xylostella TaxID=51655 RepID=A0A8S4GCP3_PLUXY|nr:unnamed protein product [Plutella xylostella]